MDPRQVLVNQFVLGSRESWVSWYLFFPPLGLADNSAFCQTVSWAVALILYHSDFKDAAHLPVQQKRIDIFFFFSCFHFTALKSQLCRAVRLVRQATLPMLWAFTFHGTGYLVTFSCCISREIFMGNARCILFHLVVVKSTVSLNKSLSPPQHCPAMLKQKSGQL